MSGIYLVTVEQAAEHLSVHPKTVLRYIHTGQLPATRVGKSYRIVRTELEAFSGMTSSKPETLVEVRATCIVDIVNLSQERAERVATFLQSAALTADSHTAPLNLQTAYDPLAKTMKVVLIGSPSDVSKLLEMVHLEMGVLS